MTVVPLLVEEPHPGVRVLTLNRPEKRNAIDRVLFDALIDAFRALDADAAIKVAILTGAGPAFCAGVDLADVTDRALLEERRRLGISPPSVLLEIDTPVLGAINGACYAGGLELALACDFLIAAEGASFADTHLKLGLLPSWGGAALLPAAIGTRNAKRIALTGLPVSAEQAWRYGLVSDVVASARLHGEAITLAQQIALAPPDQIRRLLALYDRGEGTPRAERLQRERDILLDSAIDVSRAAVEQRALGERGADRAAAAGPTFGGASELGPVG